MPTPLSRLSTWIISFGQCNHLHMLYGLRGGDGGRWVTSNSGDGATPTTDESNKNNREKRQEDGGCHQECSERWL
ncbi:hypothetical protein Hdeb2414_s0028g00699501 [Helianthus debilis subsp. tardiflorus]